MTPAFLIFANLTLLLRLICLFREVGEPRRPWLAKLALELAALGALFPLGGRWAVAVAVVTAVNLASLAWERRGRRRDFGRLLLGVTGIVALSFCFGSGGGLEFRPAWARVGDWLGAHSALQPALALLLSARAQLVAFGLLIAANEANLVIRATFDWLNLKPQTRASTPGAMELDVGEYNRGRVIGLLERALIYFFVLQGQYGVIGFTLAAKAFTRFKELDDRRFAEYVLIGTLLSSTLAVACGVAVRRLLS
jgi:hypothetical protein